MKKTSTIKKTRMKNKKVERARTRIMARKGRVLVYERSRKE